jgi:nitroreductase
MNIYEAIEKRRTVRDFQDKPVPTEVIRKIIAAGLKAPSNDHLRSWHFIVIPGRDRRAELVAHINAPQTREGAREVIDGWGLKDPIQREMYLDGIPKQHAMILNAGCLILPCFYYPWPLLKPETLPSLNAFASIWLCIENMLLAAVAEGVYGVTRIPFEEERCQLKRILAVPEGYEIPCTLALGYPAEGHLPIRQIPVEVDERIHFNGW